MKHRHLGVKSLLLAFLGCGALTSLASADTRGPDTRTAVTSPRAFQDWHAPQAITLVPHPDAVITDFGYVTQVQPGVIEGLAPPLAIKTTAIRADIPAVPWVSQRHCVPAGTLATIVKFRPLEGLGRHCPTIATVAPFASADFGTHWRGLSGSA